MSGIEQLTVIADRYEVVASLDAGGMGVVYRANDRRLGRPVAIKVVRTTEPRLAERSAREARLLARVDHPNVVRVFDAGIHDGHPFIVTELVAGRPLSHLVAEGVVAPDRTAAIGAGAASGLAATHRAGIVHRDLKPANILVSDRGVVRLLDYGVASFADLETLTLDGEVVGTPRYLAPEQVSGTEVGPPADVYALGLVLIECLTGRHPFGGTAIESMGARLTRDPDLPDGIDDRWAALLAAMTARDPLRRPSAAGVAQRMGALGTGADLRPPASLDLTTMTSIDAPDRPTATAATAVTATGVTRPPGSTATTDPTLPLDAADVTGVLTVTDPPTRGRGRSRGPGRRPSRRRWAVAAAAFVLVLMAATAGAWVLTRPAGDGGPTSPTTLPAPTSTATTPTTRAPVTTIRPTTTTTVPPTTTTTTAKGKGGKGGKGGRPGG